MPRFSSNISHAAAAADRYRDLGLEYTRNDRMAFIMDMTAADGENGNPPLDWEKLLGADDATFVHDCAGIQQHIDRRTGAIGGFFLPRCSVPE